MNHLKPVRFNGPRAGSKSLCSNGLNVAKIDPAAASTRARPTLVSAENRVFEIIKKTTSPLPSERKGAGRCLEKNDETGKEKFKKQFSRAGDV